MSSIVNQRRTDRHLLPEAMVAARISMLVATAILSALLLTFRPFTSVAESGADGDPVNQLGYGLLGAVAVASMLMLADRRVLASMASPWWLLLLAFAAFSVVTSGDSATALRSFSFTLTAIVCVAAVLTLPRDAESFASVFTFASILVLVLCYGGLLAMPEAAIHGAEGPEPEHAGLWRGVFSHKNIAGPVIACTGFVGLFLMRRGRFWLGAAILIASVVFVWNTGSRTAAGLIPITVLAVFLPRLLGLQRSTSILVAAGLVIGAIGTVGIVLLAPVGRLAAEVAPDLTYTGRLAIWEFAIDMTARRPWTGFGYESFWGAVAAAQTDLHFDMAWDVRNIVHAHNGYLDIALTMGLPALTVAIVAFVVLPLRDYARTPMLKTNVMLADMFLMMLAYTLLNALLESFFFRRADPVWIVFVLAVLGLRMTARFVIDEGPNRRG